MCLLYIYTYMCVYVCVCVCQLISSSFPLPFPPDDFRDDRTECQVKIVPLCRGDILSRRNLPFFLLLFFVSLSITLVISYSVPSDSQ